MSNTKFNEMRHNRKRQQYRFVLGIQQLFNYPVLNLIWVLFAFGALFLRTIEKKYITSVDIYPLFETFFFICVKIVFVIFPITCAIGVIHFIGFCFAIKDEADMELIFCDKRFVKNQLPMLIFKKKNRKTRVVTREFYTTIPMAQWQERKEDICDRMDIHLIGEITYGGRKRNKGNHIRFDSAKGRKQKEKGILYDETF